LVSVRRTISVARMSSILGHLIRSLAVAERQILGSRRGQTIHLPQRDALTQWCHRCGAGRSESEQAPPPHITPSHITPSHITPCHKCAGVLLERDRTIRLGSYESDWRSAILAVKYGCDHTLARNLGSLLAQQWRAQQAHDSCACANSIIVPVPMPLARRIERGIDHTSEIARGFSKALGYPLVRCLEHDAGPVQAELRRSDRQARGQRIRSKHNWAGDRKPINLVILVDDVLTTGSTAQQACVALRQRLGRVKIALVVVAVTDYRKDL